MLSFGGIALDGLVIVGRAEADTLDFFLSDVLHRIGDVETPIGRAMGRTHIVPQILIIRLFKLLQGVQTTFASVFADELVHLGVLTEALHAGGKHQQFAAVGNGQVRAKIGDLAAWVRMMSTGAEALISKEQYEQLLRKNIQTEPAADGKPTSHYAMGRRVTQRGGKTVYYHAGDMKGFNAMMGFLPGEDSGFAVAVNTNGTEAESLVGDDLLDRLCGTQQADVDRSIAEWKKDREAYDVSRRKMEALPA